MSQQHHYYIMEKPKKSRCYTAYWDNEEGPFATIKHGKAEALRFKLAQLNPAWDFRVATLTWDTEEPK